jgi:hypothetical protein
MRRIPAFALAASLGLAPALTSADTSWKADAGPTATVHGHTFDRVRLEGGGCEGTLTLDFDAPPEAYADKRNPVRNQYWFKARVGLADGRKLETPAFRNQGAGRRTYATSRVTGEPDACWASKKGRIVKLDVNGCRGPGCTIEPFD